MCHANHASFAQSDSTFFYIYFRPQAKLILLLYNPRFALHPEMFIYVT